MRGSQLQRKMWRVRVLLVIVGMLTPYLARVPGVFVHGPRWVTSYLSTGLAGFAFIQSFNCVVWGGLFALSFLVRKPSPLVLPSVAGFGFVAFAHSGLDLAADAQNAVALVFIPFYALPIIGLTFLLSVLILGRNTAPSKLSDPEEVGDRFSSTTSGPPVAGSGSGFACYACGAQVNYGASQCRDCEQPFVYSTPSVDESSRT